MEGDPDSDEWFGDELGFDGDIETPQTGSVDPGEAQLSISERFRRSLQILLTGSWQDARYGMRDRATVLGYILAVTAVVAATISLGLEATGFHPEPLWEIEVAARQALIGAVNWTSGLLLYGLNHEWVVALFAATVILAYRR